MVTSGSNEHFVEAANLLSRVTGCGVADAFTIVNEIVLGIQQEGEKIIAASWTKDLQEVVENMWKSATLPAAALTPAPVTRKLHLVKEGDEE